MSEPNKKIAAFDNFLQKTIQTGLYFEVSSDNPTSSAAQGLVKIASIVENIWENLQVWEHDRVIPEAADSHNFEALRDIAYYLDNRYRTTQHLAERPAYSITDAHRLGVIGRAPAILRNVYNALPAIRDKLVHLNRDTEEDIRTIGWLLDRKNSLMRLVDRLEKNSDFRAGGIV
jgi:hypothetical protein